MRNPKVRGRYALLVGTNENLMGTYTLVIGADAGILDKEPTGKLLASVFDPDAALMGKDDIKAVIKNAEGKSRDANEMPAVGKVLTVVGVGA